MENVDLMVILAQVINFGILFYIFKKFISDKLNKKIEERRKILSRLDKAEEEYGVILEKANSQRLDILVSARKDAQKLLMDMEDLSKVKREDIIKNAEKRASIIIQAGKREVEKEKIYMISEMKEKILDLALQLNAKILEGKEKNKKFMKKELELLI